MNAPRAILERTLGSENLEMSGCLIGLAICDRKARADFIEAKRLIEHALAIREKVLKADHADVAECLGNLASVYRDLGRNDMAQSLDERALAIFEHTLGPDHPGLAWSLTRLALLDTDRGNHSSGRGPITRALAIREKAWGMSHPEVAFSLSCLAEFELDRGHDKDSELHARRALAILEVDHAGPPTAVAHCFDILAQLETRNGQNCSGRSPFPPGSVATRKGPGLRSPRHWHASGSTTPPCCTSRVVPQRPRPLNSDLR